MGTLGPRASGNLTPLPGTSVPSGAHRVPPEGESTMQKEGPGPAVLLDKGGMEKQSLPTSPVKRLGGKSQSHSG